MKRACCLLLLAGLLLPARADDKGTVVRLDDLKSTAPASWKELPARGMRFAQFRLPRAEGDKADADLIVFKGLGGSAKQNVERWMAQFQAPEGKKLSSKVTEMKVGGQPATYLDISGTYLDRPPFAPDGKTTKRPDYRMLAIQLNLPKNVYHIKLIGPAKTVAKHKKEFDAWLGAFK